ncbi:hypothetical protein ACFQWB_05215 [Paenibacillus thermoaerophilus]|uniref:Necrosis inducing protein (NPP1) n=1 Tax=Paenibacillus thermoaerophilus TaxID=1215385 RepID=A0ABW2V282_9BACL|nr:hypothetical protein [Paenibacillus thermoaerophilus]TMV14333.1 hypothetical protein FE781_10435 [Paenibacillus thermoaerophilus]
MRKIVATVLSLSLVLSVSVASSAPNEVKPDFIAAADQAIITSNNQEDKLEDLQKLGWEVVEPIVSDEIVTPLSTSGCGNVTNQAVLKHWDGVNNRYVYLIQANWDFSNSCSFDNESDKAPDILAIAVVNANGQPVGVQGEYAQIYVRDEDGDHRPAHGNVSGASGSGIVYTIDDVDGILDNIGDNGEAWFYIQKPSGSGPFYIQSRWRHTWADTKITLTGAGITFGNPSQPIGIIATWNTTIIPYSWDVFDSDSVAFN